MHHNSYLLLDSGNQSKLERFGEFVLSRPSSQAVWSPLLSSKEWDKADATFTRDPKNVWRFQKKLPPFWTVEWNGVLFKISPTEFGHIGLFPEHALLWDWMKKQVKKRVQVNPLKPVSILNLFAYTGGATLSLAQEENVELCHVDASKTTVAWARENAALNRLDKKAVIRWIVDDALKFLQREKRRGVRYDAILLDPPTFGRGNKGEVFKIENDLRELLGLCASLLSEDPLFLLLTSHTPGYTPLVLHHLLSELKTPHKGKIETGEMSIPASLPLPSGTYAHVSF